MARLGKGIVISSHGDPLASPWPGRTPRKVAMRGIKFHDLRHTHATLLMKQGTNPKVAQERLGHSNISVTFDVYSHVVPGMQELAAMEFDETLIIPVYS